MRYLGHQSRKASLKRPFLRGFLALFVVISAPPKPASATPTAFEQWTNINSHISLDEEKHYQLYLEVQPRLGDNWQRVATSQVRAAMVYNPSKAFGVYAGYAWTQAYYDAQYHRDYREDHRIWEQLVYRYDLFGVKWQHRIRQEQRMIARTGEMAHRTRYMIKGCYALNDAGDFGLTASDEIMVNLNGVDNGPWAGYDRNRIFFGPYWIIGSGRYEIVYIGEHLKRFGSDERWANVLGVQALFGF